MVITGWSSNSTSSNANLGSLTGEYNLRNVGGLYLPPLWLNSSPTNLSDLVSSCIFVRVLKIYPIPSCVGRYVCTSLGVMFDSGNNS